MVEDTSSVLVHALPALVADVEIVEHKGLGHPDTLCDGAAEAASRALCREYLDRFGVVLHHNVDKALLVGGRARAALGGGEILEPMALTIAGRAADEVRGVRVPVREIVVEAARSYLRGALHALDVDRDLRVDAVVRPGSMDLVDLFLRRADGGVHLANDTSCGAGYAPLSPSENAVLAIAEGLRVMARAEATPWIGEDVKIMAVRRGAQLDLTIACAMIGRHLPSVASYTSACEAVLAEVRSVVAATTAGALAATVVVNAADDVPAGSLYLTVTGCSAESGDDGEVGRGNRVNGLITPYRPMTLEAAAGKNPVSHVGKLYNVAAHALAARIVAEVTEVARAECYLVSRIGRRIDHPELVDVRLGLHEGARIEHLRGRINDIVRMGIGHIPALSEAIVRGEVRMF